MLMTFNSFLKSSLIFFTSISKPPFRATGWDTIEPWAGGSGLWRARNRKWTHLPNRPLAFEPSPTAAQTFKPIGGSVPKGLHHNPLAFRRRFIALKKWLRL
jgi:hypothetical protein